MNIRKMHIILEKQDEGGYTVYIPELPGCISQGETKQDALKNIREAAELYTEDLSSTEVKKRVSRVEILPAVV